MSDVMLDLETMGVSSDAAIIAIGAVKFDINSGQINSRFYTVIDLASSVKLGGVIEASTVLWWMKQSDGARSQFSREGVHISEALVSFSNWLSDTNNLDDVKIWGNGASFDNVILSSAYRRASLEQPWKYYNDRCYRTVKAMKPEIKLQRIGTFHNAVDDAESQALHLMGLLK